MAQNNSNKKLHSQSGKLFWALIFALSSVFKDKEKKIGKHLLSFEKKFNTDHCLFEVGCYLLFQVDRWLRIHEPLIEPDVIQDIYKQYVSLFSKALNAQSNNYGILLNERLLQYADMFKIDNDVTDHLDFLINKVIEITRNVKNHAHNDENNFLEEQYLQVAIMTWEIAMMPTIIDTLSTFCEETRLIKAERIKDSGKYYSGKLKLQKSIECFTKAIELLPRDAESYFLRGNDLSMRSLFPNLDYNSDGRAVVTVDENYGKNLTVLSDLGQKALNDFTKAIELKPRYVEALISRGVFYVRFCKEHPEFTTLARQDLEKALRISPKHVLADLAEDSLRELKTLQEY